MRVGIIGTGKHGSRYARHIVHDVSGLELAAICRRSSKRREQAEEWKCRGYKDWRQLIKDDQVQAVISVVPPVLNLAIAEACVATLKPLLMEKPLAASLDDARRIVSLSQENDLPLTVGQTLRYNRVIQLLRERLPHLGSLYSFATNQRLEPSTLGWHEDPALAGAGVSFHTAVHIFDALRYITGREIRRVMAITGRRHNAALEDMLLALIEMEGSVQGVVDCSKVGAARSGRFEFVCENGQLTGDQIYNSCEIIHHADRTVCDPGEPVGTIVPLLNDWRDFITGKSKRNPIPAGDGLKAVAVCEACLRSARQKTWVDVEGE